MASNITSQKTRYKIALAPGAAVTDNTAQVTTILDNQGFGSNALVIVLGSLADADATFAVTIAESDNADMSSSNAVAAGDLYGTLAGVSFTFAADNSTRKIGYAGAKRYTQATITPSANTSTAYIMALWVSGSPGVIVLTDQAG